MKVINIVKPGCLYTDNNGKQTLFEIGEHEVEDELADHWFIQFHTDQPQAYEMPIGTPEYAANVSKRMARKKLIDAAVEEHQETEAKAE